MGFVSYHTASFEQILLSITNIFLCG